MKNQKINLIDSKEEPQAEFDQQAVSSNKKRLSKRWFFRCSIFILVLVLFFSTNIIFSQNSLITNLGKLSFWEGVARLVTGKDKILKGEILDRTNFLILGMGGAQHEGPYLTDTMILASIKPSTQQISLLSIPRDLYVPIPDAGWQKINFANALGVAQKKDGGELASQVVSNVFDLPIHYWVRVDFQIFEDLIDQLGGIEITVDNSFIDNEFPGPNFTFRPVVFEKGTQIMDGATALKFVRSRHGTNGEDSDFARAKRQQKVLFAIKEKIEEQDILNQPKKIYSLYQSLENNISSNLDLSQVIRLGKIISQVQTQNINTQVLISGPDGPLKSEITIEGSYILSPKTGDFKELAEIARNMLGEGNNITFGQQVMETNNSPVISSPKLIILNGTYINGLANELGQELEDSGFEIVKIGNTLERNYQETIIYQLNPSSPDSKIQEIKNDLDASVLSQSKLDEEIKNLFDDHQADFLIILGKK